ncbi:hypothetical protein M409DRAFT_24166 [Zasmidium cellare ATCC 36951]|uniref:Uncharacterized protein n=1 Tax=Zasmidium cellare ATCC 36951 TaxID=1080233 RepID=A0A6A6CIT0_ZASCE|nr:uncharacterized protein M409DRAFT_24166 [Zasmidium cellare ATCC 36951]KAF2165316.1 hypothetical protein M409DRAFT_24166 [Zasmidium cellare ATCC 36951]
MSLKGKNVVLTGASIGIGLSIAHKLAKEGASIALLSRSEDKLKALAEDLSNTYQEGKFAPYAVDISNYTAVESAITSVVDKFGTIDILINNAGLALGAPSPFHDLSISQIDTMNGTNVSGLMYTTHAVLNKSMHPRRQGTILNITSVTGLEVPPFPGEAVYHANKALQEAFTNALRNELSETEIRVLALRPGCVATNFHAQRVAFDREMYERFFEGFQPLTPDEVADSAIYLLQQPPHLSVKALDLVPTPQRSLNVFDRKWNERHNQ